MVSTQAAPIDRATPHRTADSRRVAPTPITDEVMMCVVETGTAYAYAVVSMTELATVWAVKPFAGVSWMIRRPSVRMIRQPPAYVPNAIAVAAASTTHSGTRNESRRPDVTSARVITPIVF